MTTADGSDGTQASELERRLEEVVAVIQEFAALRFEARATVGRAGDIVDAVAAGVNSLGEELEASYQEIERRIAERTAELAVATRELSRRALEDALTGVANRAAFWDRLGGRQRDASRHGTQFAVLFLDLDDFKTVNDSLGHAVGDRLLVEMARRIQAELRPGDTTARVGGDEFLVLLDEVGTAEDALAVAGRVNDRLRVPYELDGDRLPVTCSIGVAMGSGALATSDAIVAAADAAMYEAKRSGGGACVLYCPDRHGPASLVDAAGR